MRNPALVFLYLILLWCRCSSQTINFINYTTREGLLSDEVYNLHEDSKGYIWIFTNYGAVKYNSVEFKPVLTNLPFNESFIYCMYENKRGEKWVANSNARIYKVINDSAFAVKGVDGVSDFLKNNISEITQLFVDDSTNIYAVTKRYTYKFVNRKTGYFPVNLSYQIKYDSVVFSVDQHGDELIPTYNCPKQEKIFFYEKEKRTIGVVLNNAYNKNRFFDMNTYSYIGPKRFKQSGRNVYFSLGHLLAKIEGGSEIKYIDIGATILNFAIDKNGHIWLATLNTGLVELNEKDSLINRYLENTTINDVMLDKPYGIWASSPGKGLFHCINLKDRHFEKELPLGNTIDLLKKIDDALWISTGSGSIYRIKNKKNELLASSEKDGCLDVAVKNQAYYFPYRHKLVIGRSENGKQLEDIRSFDGLTNIFKIISIKGDSLFFMHRRGLGLIVDRKLNKRLDVKYKTYDYGYRGKDLFLATDNGMYTYSRQLPPQPLNYGSNVPIVYDTLDQPLFLNETKGHVFTRIVKDAGENLWCCSSGNGLYVLSPDNKLKHYTVADGLPGNIINNVSFGTHGDLLLSTNAGLYWFNAGSDGFKPDRFKCLYHGSVKNAVFFEGDIYIATANGLIILDHERLNTDEHVHFNLVSVLVNQREVAANQPLIFRYYENDPQFNFDVISFSSDRTGLIYKLRGPDADSGDVTGHSIKFQNLRPGKYRLVVYPDIKNNRNTRIVRSFTITPAFWQTTGFLIGLICFSVIVIVTVVLMIFRYQKRKADRRTRSEKLILEYKLIALKAQINPHFISNCLTAIQHLIIYNKLDSAADYVAKFGFFVRQILNFSTRSLVSLKEELGISRLNLELEQLRFDNKFAYHIVIDEGIDSHAVFVPSLILNPIIENAIWHGLLPLKNRRPAELLIRACIENNELMLMVEDNGVGRKLDRKNYGNTRESRGIKLIEQRLSNINYLYNITSSKLVYEDLFDDRQQPVGTRVIIFLPVNLVPLQNE